MIKQIDIQDQETVAENLNRGVPAIEDEFEEVEELQPTKQVKTDAVKTKDDSKSEPKRAHIEEFDTGSIRDEQNGKPRYDLIPTTSLKRLAQRYADGAELYGDNNWKLGQPFSRVYASLYRHLIAWRNGEEDEDHLAAVAWNAFALMHFEETMPELDDLDA